MRDFAADPRFSPLQDRKAVVFGGGGFLGGCIVEALARTGANVVCFDLRPCKFDDAHVTCVRGDMLDEAAVASAVEGSDHIFSFAGGLSALRSVAEPATDLRSSCIAQITLLEAARHLAPTASVVFAGSRLEYGPADYLPIDELHPLHPESPYAIHKATCSAYYQAYARLHQMRTVVLRLPNPFGPHAPGAAGALGYGILNLFVDTAMAGGRIGLWGGGTQLRDFVYVTDVASAALSASLVPEAAGQVFNIGSGAAHTLREAAERIVEMCDSGEIDYDAPWPRTAVAFETGDSYFDISKASRVLDWSPRVTFDAGVALAVKAMRAKAD